MFLDFQRELFMRFEWDWWIPNWGWGSRSRLMTTFFSGWSPIKNIVICWFWSGCTSFMRGKLLTSSRGLSDLYAGHLSSWLYKAIYSWRGLIVQVLLCYFFSIHEESSFPTIFGFVHMLLAILCIFMCELWPVYFDCYLKLFAFSYVCSYSKPKI